MRSLLRLTLCLLALSAVAAADSIFLFAYFGNGDTASGTLSATPNGDGSFSVLAGSGQFDGFSITLIGNPKGILEANSPSGFFTYDDQLFPGQDPLLNLQGLLFSIQKEGALELNIWGTGAGSYTAQLNNGREGNGTFSASAVPEPTTLPLVLGGSLGLALVYQIRRRYAASSAK